MRTHIPQWIIRCRHHLELIWVPQQPSGVMFAARGGGILVDQHLRTSDPISTAEAMPRSFRMARSLRRGRGFAPGGSRGSQSIAG